MWRHCDTARYLGEPRAQVLVFFIELPFVFRCFKRYVVKRNAGSRNEAVEGRLRDVKSQVGYCLRLPELFCEAGSCRREVGMCRRGGGRMCWSKPVLPDCDQLSTEDDQGHTKDKSLFKKIRVKTIAAEGSGQTIVNRICAARYLPDR